MLSHFFIKPHLIYYLLWLLIALLNYSLCEINFQESYKSEKPSANTLFKCHYFCHWVKIWFFKFVPVL